MGFIVLLVDDEKISRDILLKHINWQQLEVHQLFQADNGFDALKIAKEHHPDIIISDIKMPHMNGLELALEIHKSLPTCKFIFLSGYPDKEYLKEAIKLKVARFIEKPIDLEEISLTVKELTNEIKEEMVLDQRVIFFKDEETGCSCTLNQQVLTDEKVKEVLSIFETKLRSKNQENFEKEFLKIYWDIARYEGTEPEYIRHLFCQFALLFASIAESQGISSLAPMADNWVHQIIQCHKLSELKQIILKISSLYFSFAISEFTDIISKINQYLESHFQDPEFTINSLASHLNFTTTYLCMLYKKKTGKTINQQLTNLRINNAKSLLRNKNLKLYEVAFKSGYSDSKYFTKLFTRETGISPRKYRENCSNE